MADHSIFELLKSEIEGDLYTGDLWRKIYSTDASAYREIPRVVVIPKNNQDIKKIVSFACKNKIPVIPRAAGTSLAGQVVGNGMVVDISKHLNQILEFNPRESWVRVQPGVIRDELNMFLHPHGYFFAPETSTANRAMIGGMVGNNSCGANSLVYGSTRDHVQSIRMVLADGTEVEFHELTTGELIQKCNGENTQSVLERNIYQKLYEILTDKDIQDEIDANFPKKTIHRRNTGYAIDLLLDTTPFRNNQIPFNVCKLIAGSEGTLGFITEVQLHVDKLPPPANALICVHFHSLYESLEANLMMLKYNPYAVELIDHYILECTRENIEQKKNRFFIQGVPKAILIAELAFDTEEELNRNVSAMIEELRKGGYGYHYPVLRGEDRTKIWALRKAGLGLLANIPGDAKPVPVIEDTAVDVTDLPKYIKELNEALLNYGLSCVHYAHVGSGEIHIRPIINLKTHEGQQLYRTVLEVVAKLVKKYRGSLSGEHGDGRLRGEFIPFMIGEKNTKVLEKIKMTFDPENIFNPGKIVHTPPMNSSLRWDAGQATPDLETYFDFSRYLGIIRATEMCNGSGDCRKTHLSGGTMCPSYMATRDEKDTTRARANILREFLSRSDHPNRFNHREIADVMDLCLSCKGCKSECPSNVDMAKLKAEFLQHYYDSNGIPLRSRMIGDITKINKLASISPAIYNFFTGSSMASGWIKFILGFAVERSLPAIHPFTLNQWYRHFTPLNHPSKKPGKILLFCDEFSNYNDVTTGMATIRLLTHLGYEVVLSDPMESGRTYLSKGLVKKAAHIAEKNVIMLNHLVSDEVPLIGIEPSAILTFRDEYPDLLKDQLKEMAIRISSYTYTFEEFFVREYEAGRIDRESFTSETRKIKIHGHCFQKALSSITYTKKALTIPENFEVQVIPSGCCGMAGSFGYEKEHYDVSMKIGELVLFPAIRQSTEDTIIAASGTSCRSQIKDGTGRTALHTAEILWNAIKK